MSNQITIKQQILNKLNELGKSIDDIAYYRISPTNLDTLKGRITNIFEAKQLLEQLDHPKSTISYLGVIVFTDNTWIEQESYNDWSYHAPIPYEQLMAGVSNE